MATYKRGSKGSEVERIQAQLAHLGYYLGEVDGKFGPGTERAVKAFQQKAELTVDGKVGPKTWAVLFAPEQEAGPGATDGPEDQPSALSINRTERLQDKDYIASEAEKDLIVLHHTVGGSARSTIEFWRTDPQRVATAYIVERDGEVYELFDPKYWAYHLGLKGSGGAVDRRSIGIELASEGALTYRDGKLYCFDRVSDRTLFSAPHYECAMPWRGYRFYDAYSDAQIASTVALVRWLCDRFDIPRHTPADHLNPADEYREFRGILGHHHLRSDKSDVHPGFPWQRLIDECRLTPR